MRPTILIVLILAVAGAIRLYRLDANAPYGDEKFTLLTSNGVCAGGYNQPFLFNKKYFTPQDFWAPKTAQDYFDAVARGELGAHIPYNFALQGWTMTFGNSDFALRAFSVLFGLLTVWLLYLLVLENTKDRRLALIVGGLAAIEPLIFALNRMIRSYSFGLFLVVLATYLFFKILNNRQEKIHYYLYALVVALAGLTHFLNFMVVGVHGILVLLYIRDFKKWIWLSVAVGFAGAVLAWWLTFGGGVATFKFIKDKNDLHRKMALLPPDKNPMAGGVVLPTFQNLAPRFTELVADQFITTNGLTTNAQGKKNTAICLLATLLVIAIVQFSKHKWRYGFIYGIILVGTLLYSDFHIGFLILQTNLILLFFAIKGLSKREVKSYQSLLVFSVLLCILPYLYLLFDAISSGHTGNLTQRYASFAMPFALVLVGYGIRQLWGLPALATIPLFVGLLLQLIIVIDIDKAILMGSSPKYTYTDKPRIANPYRTAAKQIIAQYAPGDTVLYPSYGASVYSSVINDATYMSVADAQNTMVYLPKEATYWQRIDPNEGDRIILKKANGQKKVLFDLKGMMYRY